MEFWPVLRMTFPADLESISDGWQPGKRLFRSWILLFGFLPVEYDDLTLVELEEGHRLLERSKMFTQKYWQHERELSETGAGVRIVDRVVFESRFSSLEAILLMIFRQVFRYRHFRLRQLYGHLAA